jgi:SSS family solute:Na+ symporter
MDVRLDVYSSILTFFIIGSSLYAYYEVHPELLNQLKLEVVKAKFPNLSSSELIAQAAQLKVEDYGDKVMPHFMVHKIPVGLMGLIISALLSAAMSTISSGMNASATVFSIDIYQRYFVKDISDKSSLRILHTSTVIFGFLGLASGMAMIGVKSILDIWWQLSGLFAAGMLGLFLLGLFSKKATNQAAIIATLIGLVVICWVTFSDILPAEYDGLKSHLHKNMSIVLGTVTLFISGVIVTKLMAKNDS